MNKDEKIQELRNKIEKLKEERTKLTGKTNEVEHEICETYKKLDTLTGRMVNGKLKFDDWHPVSDTQISLYYRDEFLYYLNLIALLEEHAELTYEPPIHDYLDVKFKEALKER